MTIDEIVNRAIGAGVRPDEIVGCTDEEIAFVERAAGRPLPLAYKEFLAQIGNGAGSFRRDLDVFLPAIKWLLRDKDEIKSQIDLSQEENGFQQRVPNNAFIFASSQGIVFYYFLIEDGVDDPAVYGPAGSVYPVSQLAPSFTDFLASGLVNLREKISWANEHTR